MVIFKNLSVEPLPLLWNKLQNKKFFPHTSSPTNMWSETSGDVCFCFLVELRPFVVCEVLVFPKLSDVLA